MHASEVTPETIERVNALYWDSGRSVNQIAEELDLSKGALYGVISPRPSGLGCPLCGAEVGYPNRTAQERGSLECPTCAWDGSVDETTSYVEDDLPAEDEASFSALARNSTDQASEDPLTESIATGTTPRPPAFVTPDLGTVVKGALIGGAVGLVLVFWARRR